MTFSNAVDETANKARKGVIGILRTLWRLGNFSATIFLKMFVAEIKPIVLYGLDIVGLKEYRSVEKVHTFALKKAFESQSKNTQRHGVRGDRSFSFVRSFLYVLYRLPQPKLARVSQQ